MFWNTSTVAVLLFLPFSIGWLLGRKNQRKLMSTTTKNNSHLRMRHANFGPLHLLCFARYQGCGSVCVCVFLEHRVCPCTVAWLSWGHGRQVGCKAYENILVYVLSQNYCYIVWKIVSWQKIVQWLFIFLQLQKKRKRSRNIKAASAVTQNSAKKGTKVQPR